MSRPIMIVIRPSTVSATLRSAGERSANASGKGAWKWKPSSTCAPSISMRDSSRAVLVRSAIDISRRLVEQAKQALGAEAHETTDDNIAGPMCEQGHARERNRTAAFPDQDLEARQYTRQGCGQSPHMHGMP